MSHSIPHLKRKTKSDNVCGKKLCEEYPHIKKMKQQSNGKNYIMRHFIICTCQITLLRMNQEL